MAALLPIDCIRLIAALLVRDESPSNRVLCLLAFCGTCQRWRQVGAETQVVLSYDGAEGQYTGPKASTQARFRKADVMHKRNAFLGASRLLAGEPELPGFLVCSRLCIRIQPGPGLA